MKRYDVGMLAQLRIAAEDILREARSTDDSRATVFALSGDLGAGKTTFVQICGEILCVDEQITSPTFTIMKRYGTEDPRFSQLVHIDAYRIESPEEMSVLNLNEVLEEARTLVCIEWPERIAEVVPDHALTLTFGGDGGNERTLTLA